MLGYVHACPAISAGMERLHAPEWNETKSLAGSLAIPAAIVATAALVALVGIHLAWGLPAIFQVPPEAAAMLLTLVVLVVAAVLWFTVFYWRGAEAARREQETNVMLAAAAANIGLWTWDMTADKVWTTTHCRNMLGIEDNAECSLSAFLEHMHPDDAANLRETIEKTIAAGGKFQMECRLRSPDKQARWLSASGHASHHHGRPLAGVTVVLADLTQLKEAEAEVARQQEQVTHLTRVDILNALSGAIAHQLNQPLSAILSNAQAVRRMIARRSPDTVELGDALGDIIDDDNRAVEIIRQFRALLKKGEANFESIDLNAVLTRALEFARPDLRVREVRTVKKLSSGPLMIRGDQIQLQQVILNLIINASESLVANSRDNRVLTVSTIDRGETVELTVSDNGPGISPETLPHLFESFRSTKKHGLGLGLSISRSIVSAHGGNLWAGNNADGGADFYVKLPALSTLNP